MADTKLHASVEGEIELPEIQPYSFEGRSNPDVRLQFYGMFNNFISIGNVCSQIGRQLTSAISGSSLHSYTGLPFLQKHLDRYAFLNKSAPIGFFYGVPNAVPDFFFEHETTIGGFACETNAIPQSWVEIINRFDLIIVPSHFCKTAFLHSGVITPIFVVHHGLEPEYRAMRARERSGQFVFYNTFNSITFPGRKGCEELIRCFVKAFSGRSDVRLRLRAQHNATVNECLNKYEAKSLVTVDRSKSASTSDFASIYSDIHCTVHPSKGEGFGLIPFQSIACETPVIAPCSTGMKEYLNTGNAMVLRTSGETKGEDVYYKTGTYPMIDEEHLVELLRYAEGNWETEYEKVKQVAPEFREKFSWENVLTDLVSLIQSLLEFKDPQDRKNIICEKCASDGEAMVYSEIIESSTHG